MLKKTIKSSMNIIKTEIARLGINIRILRRSVSGGSAQPVWAVWKVAFFTIFRKEPVAILELVFQIVHLASPPAS